MAQQFMTFIQQFNFLYTGFDRMIYPTNGDAIFWAKQAKEAGTFPSPAPDDPYAKKGAIRQ